ncbi:RNA-directed DNA polymerase, eukaryota, reverse transcriptase zinc-binding domain protein [Tanacetum coccineum]
MRSQRQSKVPSKFDDTIHSINNSKNNKNKSVSKNKRNDKNCDNNKDSVSKDGENIMNLETEREEEEVNNVVNVVNKEGDTRDDSVNGDEHVVDLFSENIEGLLGSGVHEVHSSSTPDSNANIDDNLSKSSHSSYASVVKNDDIPNSLDFIPTVITETGNEVVIFDEEIVKQGSERWCLTVCGHFVGYDMYISELRYNIRRMWGKFGIADIDKWKNEMKPEIGMTKVEPKKLPVWVKITNLPLEAWCVKGISEMASSLGKPILMDTVTATICHKGIVLIVGKRGKKKGYDEGKNKDGTDAEFVTQGRKKQQWNDFKNNGTHGNQQSLNYNNNKDFKRRHADYTNKMKNYEKSSEAIIAERNKWRVKDNVVKEIRTTANKYSILDSLPDDNYSEIQKLKERMIVDKFLNEKIQPTLLESITWSNDMIKYFKDKWVDDKMPKDTGNIEEDVLEINNGTANVMGDQDIREKQNEVINIIRSEKLNVCAVLETRLKSKKLVKACDRVFQGWNWVSNMNECSKGCRIVVGWNEDDTSIQVIHQNSQAIFCVINARKYSFKCFYTFVYAANEGFERRLLWVDLENEKRYVNGNPWCLSGDMNVTLHPNEHSSGSSIMTADICPKDEEAEIPSESLGMTEIDGDPHNPSLREMKANLVKEFHEAEADEEKFLFQQAKIKWLSKGDKNSSFFHKVLKGRSNKSKILSLCDSNG